MKFFILLLLLHITLNSAVLNAQVTQEWVRTFNGTGNSNDEAVAIAYDGLGNVIVTGRVISTGNNNDFATVKYNSTGVQQWSKIYNGVSNSYDEATGLVCDDSGNVYVTGRTLNTSSGYDIVLIKYTPSGVQQWDRIWTGASNYTDVPNDITSDNSGNIYVTGWTENVQSGNYITLKYNSSGTLLWEKQYNSPGNNYDEAVHVKADNSGNVYVTGNSVAPGSGSDFLTLKYNSAGDTVWTRRYNGTTASNEIPQGFDVDAAGNAYVTGFSTGTGTGIDFVTIKYNASGTQQWLARYDSTGGQDIPEDLEADDNGNVYVTGRTRINSSYNDFVTIKYNSAGVRQWLAVYDNPLSSLDDYGHDLILDASGNVYVTGYSNTDGSDTDVKTIKYSNSGSEQWIATYDMTGSEEGYSITLDETNNLYVTGYQDDINADFLIIKYSQSVGISTISNEVPEKFKLSQNYPNPFNPVTNLGFGISDLGFVSLKVYDVQGREVTTLVNEQLAPGTYEVDFNGSNFTSGVYFYRLVTEKFIETKKMILTK